MPGGDRAGGGPGGGALLVLTLALLVGCATPGERSREVEAHLKLGLSALVVGDLPAAARHLQAARRLDPGDPRVPCALGELYRREGRYEKAIAALKEALRLKPDYPEAYNCLGDILRRAGKMDESEGYGELDLYDPNFVKNYLITFTSLPSQVQKQKKDLEDIKEILVELSEISAKQTETLETFRVAMQQHLALIHELRETTNALREAVEELRRAKRKPRRTVKPKEKPKPKPRGLFGKISDWWRQGYQE